MAIHSTALHRVDDVTLYAYALPLTNGQMRKGFLLQSHTTDRWGEAAPLPLRSKESWEETREQLLTLFATPTSPFPSVRFALESLLSTSSYPLHAPLWVLLIGTEEEILRQARYAKQQGARYVKIKTSNLTPTQITNILRTLEGEFHLRIDCNRSLSYQEAVDIFAPFTSVCIEEPTYELERLAEFPYPFALDETLEEFPDFPLDTCPQLTTLILKPTLLGGYGGCKRYIDWANAHQKEILFTGAFESGIGTLNVLSLAQKNSPLPVGISTYNYLAKDILKDRLHLGSTHATILSAPQINPTKLEEIAHGTIHLPPL